MIARRFGPAAHQSLTAWSAVAAQPHVAAAAVLRRGLERLVEVAGRLERKGIPQRRGDLFEYIVGAKFNAEAVRMRRGLLALLTREVGRPHAPSDIDVVHRAQIILHAQLKMGVRPDYLVQRLAVAKYRTMSKVVPSDLVEEVRAYALDAAGDALRRGSREVTDLVDTALGVTGELQVGRVRASGATVAEAQFAAEHPALYATTMEATYVARAVGEAAAEGARVGALMTAALALVERALGSQPDPERAGANLLHGILSEALDGGVAGGGRAALGTLTQYASERLGIETLARPELASALTAALVDIGGTVLRYARGEITADDASLAIGSTGCGTVSAVFVTAAGATLGAAGALLGPMVASVVAAEVYAACVLIRRRAQLAAIEAQRLELLAAQAVEAIGERREWMNDAFAREFDGRDASIVRAFAAIEEGATTKALDLAGGLGELLGAYGCTLGFPSFEEFDAFMRSGDGPLRL